MSMLAQNLRKMSGDQLLAELAYKTKDGHFHQETYLNCVRWEIQRRAKKKQRRAK